MIYIAAFQSLLPQIGFRWTVRVLAFMAAGIFGMAIPALIYSSPKHVRSSSRRRLFDAAAFRDIPFLVYSLSSFLIFLGYLVPFFYIPSFGQTVLGMSASSSFWALAISGATSIVGRLASAVVAQRVGIMGAWVGCAAISAILCFCWIAINDTASFYAFCALYGRQRTTKARHHADCFKAASRVRSSHCRPVSSHASARTLVFWGRGWA